MAKDPAVLFFPNDFIASTALWNNSDVGLYIRLLCYQHINDGIAPDDFAAQCDDSEKVRSKFRLHENGRYYNDRMLAETTKRKSYSESRRQNVASRYKKTLPFEDKQTPTYEPTYVDDMNLHMGNRNSISIDNSNTSRDREIAKREREAEEAQIEARFNRFWGSYPRKVQKIDARRAFVKLNPDDELLGAIIKAVEASKGSKDWTDDGGAYIPYPATYLNGRRWEDEPTKIPTKPRYGNFDPNEAMERAIARSFKKGDSG